MEHHEYCQRSPIASITLTLPNQEYLKISIIKYRIINVSHFLFFLVYLRNFKKMRIGSWEMLQRVNGIDVLKTPTLNKHKDVITSVSNVCVTRRELYITLG